MLEALLFAALPAMAPPEISWTARKRLLRERVAEVVMAGNAAFDRSDSLPQLALDRLPSRHGQYNHAWNVITLDLESLHDPEKFWHVYHVTIPHEWAHGLNRAMGDRSGHGDNFGQVYAALRRTADSLH